MTNPTAKISISKIEIELAKISISKIEIELKLPNDRSVYVTCNLDGLIDGAVYDDGRPTRLSISQARVIQNFVLETLKNCK